MLGSTRQPDIITTSMSHLNQLKINTVKVCNNMVQKSAEENSPFTLLVLLIFLILLIRHVARGANYVPGKGLWILISQIIMTTGKDFNVTFQQSCTENKALSIFMVGNADYHNAAVPDIFQTSMWWLQS